MFRIRRVLGRRLSSLANAKPSEELQIIQKELLESLKKEYGVSEEEAVASLANIESEIDTVLDDFSSLEHLKSASASLEQQMTAATTFAFSTSPFQTIASSASTFVTVIDPSGLEREIQLTGQQLSDQIRQLQADLQFDTNLELKRNEEGQRVLEERVEEVSAYAKERISFLNSHLERVSRQALTAIGGFIGVLATVFLSYSLMNQN